jgi:hypothetical protein
LACIVISFHVQGRKDCNEDVSIQTLILHFFGGKWHVNENQHMFKVTHSVVCCDVMDETNNTITVDTTKLIYFNVYTVHC